MARRDLRYFNPVGAHESGLIGESPRSIPNNLMPYICQAAIGKRGELRIFGNDYPTKDGTGVRDYIHVLDLAEGHVAALDALGQAAPGTVMTINLGTGPGCSVLELVETFERANGVKIPRRIVERRPGDIAVCYADAALAKRKRTDTNAPLPSPPPRGREKFNAQGRVRKSPATDVAPLLRL
jgi:UDP-glucose 4-epimerase